MDKTKRWYLWEFADGNMDVYKERIPTADEVTRCTEVRLVPVVRDGIEPWDDDDVEYDHLDNDGLATLRVAPDSLEAAIAGTRRGERWETFDHRCLIVEPGGVWVVGGGPIPETGWNRVEEPLRCPACGTEANAHKYCGKWTVSCPACELRFGNGSVYPFNTEAEARDAWRKMGGAR